MKRPAALLLLLCVSVFSHGQLPPSPGSADIYLGLQKLKVLGSVLYVAAHPDDENTRLLAWLSRERQYRTGYLSLTRGDGGQNLIGNEQGVELGLIRTQELLAARRIDGAEQFFSRAYDFGFSKTADETLLIWNKEKILSDLVWIIRNFKPDVIITRFPGDSRAGHGHHWSSALLANEAFAAAADPNRFTEQFKYGVAPWQAKRILWNAFIFGSNTVPPGAFRMDVGRFNPLLGKGYGEIASESRSNHKSQGFGAARTRGESFEYFITTGGDSASTDIFEGVNTGWDRAGHPELRSKIDSIISNYRFDQPQLSVPALVALYRYIKTLPDDNYWKLQKLKEVQQLVEGASGLFCDATSSSATVVQGDSIRVNFLLNNRNSEDVSLSRIEFESFDSTLNTPLKTNRNFSFTRTLPVSRQKNITQPYWLRYSMPNGSFEVRDQLLIGKAENDPPFTVSYTLVIAGEAFVVERPVQYRYTDPVKGEIYQPVAVLPPHELDFEKDIYVGKNGAVLQPVIKLKHNSAADTPVEVRPRPFVTQGWTIRDVSTAGDRNAVTVQPDNKRSSSRGTIQLTEVGDSLYAGSRRTISYDHIPAITWFSPARASLLNLEVKTSGRKIGYIAGAGDFVAEALHNLGFEVIMLDKENITDAALKDLDAVVTGIRAYNVHAYLSEKFTMLMNYVKNGGNLIVQYNTNNQIGPVRAKIGPYDFNISRKRVTEEDATVSFALPGHPVLNYPNKITAADFNDWIQERSVYEADPFDPSFAAPIVMNDKNEKPGNGSLIIAKYGRGNFVYTGLALFRQLPAGVPGAYRLLANLIALPKNK
ncbi:MAG TPA: PIG-L family deacetylase [Chitinophagaceae bacterium]